MRTRPRTELVLEWVLVDRSALRTRAEARMAIFGPIEAWCNPPSLRSRLGCPSAQICERRSREAACAGSV